VPFCWLASDLRYVGNSLVPVCWLASDLRSVCNSLAPTDRHQRVTNRSWIRG
jgi:hypothetical protein